MKKPAAQAVEACQLLATVIQGRSLVPPSLSIIVNARLSDVLVELGRYEEAQAPARQTLAAAEAWKAGDPAVVAAQCGRLAIVMHRSGKLAEAEPLFRRALAILEAALGPLHPDVGTSLNNLASLLKDQGKFAEAEPLLRRALTILEAALGPQHPSVAISLSTLAELLRARGKLAEAEPLFRRALAILEAALGPLHPHVSTSLLSLAELLRARGKLAEAEPLLRRALAIDEAALGPLHPEVATSLNNLAGLLRDRGKPAEAESLLRRSLAIRETSLGPQHPAVATALHNLAKLLQDRGKYSEAEPLYTRALAICEAAWDPQHPAVAAALHGLAMLLKVRGKYAEAEPLLRRTLAIYEAALGLQHPDVATALYDLAWLLQARGSVTEAEPLYRRSLAIRETVLGPLHPDVASSLNDLAVLLTISGKLAEAEPLYRRSLAIREAALGSQHRAVATTLSDLAGLLKVRGKLAEAEALVTRALAISEAALGPLHPDVATALNNLAGLIYARGKLAEAEPLFRRALAIKEAALGPLHPDVATSLDHLAVLSLSRGKPGPALDAFSRAVAIRESTLRTSPSEDYAQALLQSWQREQMRIFGLPLLLPHEPRALDLALRAALLNKSRTQDVGALVNQALRSRLRTDAQREQYARMQQLLADRAQLLNMPGGEEKRKQEQKLLWEAQQLNQFLSQELGVASTQSLPDVQGIRETVAAALPADAALVEVVLGQTRNWQAPTQAEKQASIRDHYLALVLYRGGQTEAIDLGAPQDIHKVVMPLLAALRNPKESIREKAKAAYGEVFAKLDESLKRRGIRQLVISPEMTLQLLPWQALHDGAQYLVDRYAVRYVAAGRDLLRLPSAGPPQQAAVLANPADRSPRRLFVAEAAAQAIAQRTGARFFAGKDATEANLQGAVSPFTLLLATHGEYEAAPTTVAVGKPAPSTTLLAYAARLTSWDAGSMLMGLPSSLVNSGPGLPDLSNIEEAMHRSRLLLQPGLDSKQTAQDGKLTAEEVLGLRLQGTQLVTLLACEGGLGALELGQGVYGLRRAFLQAGAETVVSSLWSVDEPSASKLIRLYYAKLLQGKKGRVEALDEAMKELRADKEHPEYSHPHYWAPFVVLGMDGPLRLPSGVPVAGR